MEFKKLPPYRIAILNPYLQQGNRQKAEVEAAKRMILSGHRLGLQVRVFSKSEQLFKYRPNLVLCHAYQDAKLTTFPTYGTLTMPPSWVADVRRFQRNILTYDAYITIAPAVVDYVNDLSRPLGKQLDHVYAAFSAQQTEFRKPDFRRAFASYVGTNWDGSRYKDFFIYFARSKDLKCYGPKRAWRYLDQKFDIYGGNIPFDGRSVLKVYRHAGIGLCINQRDFDLEGIPTSRVFEIPASSAVMIAGDNALIKHLFEDRVLYVTSSSTPYEMFGQVQEHIRWVRDHPEEAAEKAREAHRFFNEQLSLEVFLQNIVQHYEEKFGTGYATGQMPYPKERVETVILPQKNAAGLERLLRGLEQQRVKPACIHLLVPANLNPIGERRVRLAKKIFGESLHLQVHHVAYREEIFQIDAIARILQDSSANWFSILRNDDVLFESHYLHCLETACKRLRDFPNEPPPLIYTGVVDYTEKAFACLPELQRDESLIKRWEKLRIGYFTLFKTRDETQYYGRLYPGGILFPKDQLQQVIAGKTSLISIIYELTSKMSVVFAPHVTLMRKVPVTRWSWRRRASKESPDQIPILRLT